MSEAGYEGYEVFEKVFYSYLAVGGLVALVALWNGVFRFRIVGQIILLLIAAIALWMGLAFGVHMGYGAWQNSPNPGDKAFADGANLTGAFMFGWMPAGAVCFAAWGLLHLVKLLFRRQPARSSFAEGECT